MAPPRTCECMRHSCATCQSREYARKKHRLKAYGQWDPKGDLPAVLAHLEHLRQNRIGLQRISELTGLSRSTLFRIRSGGNKWVTKAVADMILSVQPDATVRINPVGVSRRIRGLMALGWSTYYLADRLQTNQGNVWELSKGRRWVKPETFAAVCALYEELSMKQGPSKVTKARAQKAGHVPPLAWDDIDDTDERPHTGTDRWGRTRDADVDPVVVTRILAGDWRLSCTAAEKAAVVAAWDGSHYRLAKLTGWKVERYTEREDVA